MGVSNGLHLVFTPTLFKTAIELTFLCIYVYIFYIHIKLKKNNLKIGVSVMAHTGNPNIQEVAAGRITSLRTAQDTHRISKARNRKTCTL